MKLLKKTLIATALIALAPAAMAAGTATATLNVTLDLQNTCGITATPVSFGTRTTLENDIDSTGSVTVTCTSTGGTYTITFNRGTTPTGTIAQRQMRHSGGDTINYNLYTSAARTTVLGDGNNDTGTLSGTGNATAQVYTVYGRVASGQNPKAVGAYSDAVTATVSF